MSYRLTVLPEIQTPIQFPPAPPTPAPAAVNPTAETSEATSDIIGDALTPILEAAMDSNGYGTDQ